MAKLTKPQKLIAIIVISSCFFLAEISVGFYTESLALVADAFHYLNDLIGFIVALVAFKVSERTESPPELSYGYQRATLLGAFFNGVFLLALGVSIFLQAIDRFVSLHTVDNPKLVVIIGCIGFGLNVLSATILHEHDHQGGDHDLPTTPSKEESSGLPAPGGGGLSNLITPHGSHRHTSKTRESKKEHDLGIMGVLVHVMGDAFNNIGVIIAGTIIWQTHSPKRFYADPAVSVAIAMMILLSSIPIVRRSGYILLDSVPNGVDPSDVKHDIEQIPGILAVHELHIRRLNQQKALASAHIVISETELSRFETIANTASECFHAYGIHSVTLQPEVAWAVRVDSETEVGTPETLSVYSRKRHGSDMSCKLGCKVTTCDLPACCD